MKLYLATITHRHGTGHFVGLTEEQLYAELATYVRMNLFEMGEPPKATTDRELVEEYFADDKVQNFAEEFVTFGEPEEIGTLSMLPWDVAEGEPGDPRPWAVNLKTFDQTRIDIEATCPDGTKREVWIEIDKGNLVVHAYDPEHDEPVNVRIGKTGVTIDDDREDPVAKLYREKLGACVEFVQQMARFTTPEEETEDDVDEYIADFDVERLYGEYHTFMDMIRAAKELVK